MKTARARNSVRIEQQAPRRAGKRRVRRRRMGDWFENIPSREHIPFAERTAESIEISSRLSKLPMIGREKPGDVVRMIPSEINPILQIAGIEFVLVGAHGLATWLAQPRATQDVDYIIRERDARRAAQAIQKHLPNMELEKHPDVWRFKREGEYVVDLILTRTPLHKRVYKEYLEAGRGKHRYRVPKVEAALAMKFAAFTGHYRPPDKKFLDAGDFLAVIRHNQKIDLELLRELCELVYPGGGNEVLGYVTDARAGRTFPV